MSTEMKLIMEEWRGFLNEGVESDAPQTVGELLDAINKFTLIRGNKARRIVEQVIAILGEALGEAQALNTGPEDIRAIIEALEDFLENVMEQGVGGAAMTAIKEFPATAVIKFLTRPEVAKFVAAGIGPEAFKTLIETVLPGAATIFKFGRWMSRIFKVSKAAQAALETAKASPQEVFTMLVKDIATAPDNKETTSGFMGLFNVDDQWQKMLHDKVEMEFIKFIIETLKSKPPNTSLDELNFNDQMVDWLQSKFQGRYLGGSPRVSAAAEQ